MTDDVEPRIIALGARAALLRKPVLWEGNLTINQDTKSLSNNNWDKLQVKKIHTALIYHG